MLDQHTIDKSWNQQIRNDQQTRTVAFPKAPNMLEVAARLQHGTVGVFEWESYSTYFKERTKHIFHYMMSDGLPVEQASHRAFYDYYHRGCASALDAILRVMMEGKPVTDTMWDSFNHWYDMFHDTVMELQQYKDDFAVSAMTSDVMFRGTRDFRAAL